MQYPEYKFGAGLKQKEDPEVSPGLQEANGVMFQKAGSAWAVPAHEETTTYGVKTHSLGIVGLGAGEMTLAGAGTNLYRGLAVLKSDMSGENIDFASRANRAYFITKTDGLLTYDGVSITKAGSPIPVSTGMTAVDGGGSGGFDGTYDIRVTYVNAAGYESTGSTAISTGALAADSDIDVSSIPLNTDSDYKIIWRRLWIRDGDGTANTVSYSDYTLLYTIEDNVTTSVSGIATTDVTSSTTLSANNTVPPTGYPFIEMHYDVMFMAGDDANPNTLRYSKTANPEAWPATQTFFISDTGDRIMAIRSWDGVLWIFTRRKIYQMIGTPGSGTLSTNFFIKETQSTAGTIAPRSVTPTPYGIFFQAEDGVRVFSGQTSEVISLDAEDDFDNRNTQDIPESQSVGAFWDNKFVLSYAYQTSTIPNRVLIHDFETQAWTSDSQEGFWDFASDRKTNTLHGASQTGISRLFHGETYAAGAVRKTFAPDPKSYQSWGKFQVDLEGEATAEVYLDGTLRNTYTLTSSSRGFVTRRFPPQLAARADIRLSWAARSARNKFYSIAVSGETQRGQV